MFAELAVGGFMVLLTVLIHGVGIFGLGRFLRIEAREEAAEHIHPMSPHGIEIWAYAIVYRIVDAIPTFEQAIYFSTITYSTTGYNSEGLDAKWQMIAAIEGLNGFILLGWSTAFFVTVVARMGRR